MAFLEDSFPYLLLRNNSKVLGKRREQYGLELSAAKTRIIPFSRPRHAGKTSCEFLGFEFRWGKDRKGQDHLKRRTARKKLRTVLKRFTAWCQEHRHLRLPVLFQRLNATLRGYTITTECTGTPPA